VLLDDVVEEVDKDFIAKCVSLVSEADASSFESFSSSSSSFSPVDFVVSVDKWFLCDDD
jgi:hypothetical protein